MGEGLGIVCGQRASVGTMGEGVTRAGFLEEGSLEMSWTEGRCQENGCGLKGEKMEWVSGDKGVSARRMGGWGEGAEPLRCQFSPRM